MWCHPWQNFLILSTCSRRVVIKMDIFVHPYLWQAPQAYAPFCAQWLALYIQITCHVPQIVAQQSSPSKEMLINATRQITSITITTHTCTHLLHSFKLHHPLNPIALYNFNNHSLILHSRLFMVLRVPHVGFQAVMASSGLSSHSITNPPSTCSSVNPARYLLPRRIPFQSPSILYIYTCVFHRLVWRHTEILLT